MLIPPHVRQWIMSPCNDRGSLPHTAASVVFDAHMQGLVERSGEGWTLKPLGRSFVAALTGADTSSRNIASWLFLPAGADYQRRARERRG
jgi:hypothetical protein